MKILIGLLAMLIFSVVVWVAKSLKQKTPSMMMYISYGILVSFATLLIIAFFWR